MENCRCGPHVTNLACQAIISAITDLKLAEFLAPDYDPQGTWGPNAQERDTIALLQNLIWAVSTNFTISVPVRLNLPYRSDCYLLGEMPLLICAESLIWNLSNSY